MNYYLFEFYSSVKSNEWTDVKEAGDFVKVKSEIMPLLLNRLSRDGVQFAVYSVGNCVGDYSYSYEFKGVSND